MGGTIGSAPACPAARTCKASPCRFSVRVISAGRAMASVIACATACGSLPSTRATPSTIICGVYMVRLFTARA
ncbi:MAG: hypothetical protein A2092_05360 [Rhodobacteraceae bacterium GWE1_64_9]|nr:MAG: hypothetical protein A2092_05360 [Rhodobacteraceae bacterium GWE1_64_9]